MANLNDICDIAGIAVILSAFFICGWLLISSYMKIQGRLPCEIRITQRREEFMYDNIHTALLNFFNTGFGAFALCIWKLHELDTAPTHVDVMVLMLVIMTSITMVRSSVCSRRNILRLIQVRITDSGCGQCPDCKHREDK